LDVLTKVNNIQDHLNEPLPDTMSAGSMDSSRMQGRSGRDTASAASSSASIRHTGPTSRANLPASAGLVLLLAALVALICANTPLADAYHRLMSAELGVVASDKNPLQKPSEVVIEKFEYLP